jgi:hypothetical protein
VNSSANQPLTWSGEMIRGCDTGAFTLGSIPGNWMRSQLHARARIWYGKHASTNVDDPVGGALLTTGVTRRRRKGPHAQT